MEINISKHAKERYAERIMDKTEKIDVATFIAQHEDKIKADIGKMIEYGALIFKGKSLAEPKTMIEVYLKDTWVILMDSAKRNVITLYSIDLGLGRDFNVDYIERVCCLIDEAKKAYHSAESDCVAVKYDCDERINDNNLLIGDYKFTIKKLEEENQSLMNRKMTVMAQLTAAENNLREKVSILIGKKVW